jgi:hypothetical protein
MPGNTSWYQSQISFFKKTELIINGGKYYEKFIEFV